MSAVEIAVSRVARWAGNHQLAGAGTHLSYFTMLSISTGAKEMLAGSFPVAIISAEVGVKGVACHSRHKGKSSQTLLAVTVH